jgi:PPM family protein phosphatase
MDDARRLRAAHTIDDIALEQLRRDGLLGPFVPSDMADAMDVGTVRPRNEDFSHAAADGVLAVADGIGGRPGGAVAARTAVAAVAERAAGLHEAGVAEFLVGVRADIVLAGQRRGYDALGTTLVLLVAHRSHVVVASVGDSRAYRWRGGELEQLTVDHNVLSELLASGVSREQAEGSNLPLDALTAHLGPRSPLPLRSHIASYSIAADDRFLLCTDGIHGQLDHLQMTALVATGSCADAVDALLDAARAAGGEDNAAVALVEFAGGAAGSRHG